MQVIKPHSLSLLHKPLRMQQRDHWVLAVLGFFPLRQPCTCFLPEQQGWPGWVKHLPKQCPPDELLIKPVGEWLLVGQGYAPHEPVTTLMVGVQVGSLVKNLRVVGDRQWHYNLAGQVVFTEPLPFQQQPVDYAHSFGGKGYKENPLGVGFISASQTRWKGPAQGKLPNIEDPDTPVTKPWQHYEPVSFLPLDLSWPQRQRWAGTYDQQWIAQNFPGLASDADPRLGNRAAIDQQLKQGFWQGGEQFRLTHLHPTLPVIEGTLPTFRVRSWVQQKSQDASTFAIHELPLNLDTIWFIPEADLGVAVYRGTCQLNHPDAEDIQQVLLAYEHAEEPVRPYHHYQPLLETEGQSLEEQVCRRLNESLLLPSDIKSLHSKPASTAHSAQDQQPSTETKAATQQAAMQGYVEQLVGDQLKTKGVPKVATPSASNNTVKVLPLDVDSKPLKISPPSWSAVQQGKQDLYQWLKQTRAIADDVKTQAKQQQQQARAALTPLKDVAAEQAGEKSTLQQGSKQDPWQQLEASSSTSPDAEINHESDESVKKTDASSAPDRLQLAQWKQQTDQGRYQARLHSPTVIVVDDQLDSQTKRHFIITHLQQNFSLKGMDCSGVDLRGIDLQGIDAQEALFENCNLQGVNCAGGDFRGAVFTGACLNTANFSRCQLQNANLSQVTAHDACFEGAILDHGLAEQADFTRANCQGVQAKHWRARALLCPNSQWQSAVLADVLLLGAKGTASQWQQSQWHQVIAYQADFNFVNWQQTRLSRCVLMGAKTEQANCQQAHWQQVFCGSAACHHWQGAGFQAYQCSWRESQLLGSQLEQAQFAYCDFSNSDLSNCQASDSHWYRCLFGHTQLQKSEFTRANFLQSRCRSSQWYQCELNNASLIQTDFTHARLEDCSLTNVYR
ncbi:DUF2169 domain-containing protein [Zooshikella sp. RANM57]|uniref:DUF2169 family type VI secretion system accessory protein n=1 Tax=Zooshikella sp. RANM57 TaxID=3425863 RepID=UPI003D6F6AFD